jgi:hypothetical protein
MVSSTIGTGIENADQAALPGCTHCAEIGAGVAVAAQTPAMDAVSMKKQCSGQRRKFFN